VSSEPQNYRVKGHELAVTAQQSPTPPESSTTSLQLKPERTAMLPPQRTPSRTECSEQQTSEQTHDEHDMVTIDPSNCVPLTRSAHPQNALDEAILEAKAIEYLVSFLTGKS